MNARYKQIWDMGNKYVYMTKKNIYDDPISFVYKNTTKEQWHNFFEDMKKEGIITNDKR
jgi:recombinational DNA repair protein RecT